MSDKKHTIYVLAIDGKPLTPCDPSKSRKLMRGGVAKPVWSKFGTFGIQMLVKTRRETPQTTVGVDNGTKFEGYTVVCGEENNLAIKLDLPDKKGIVRKLNERRTLRRSRRSRKCRCRKARFSNRRREGFLAPSQAVIVNSRLKVLQELFRIYPIDAVAFENIRFNHAKHRWGANFSTIEIGKAKLREFFAEQGIDLFEFRGWETKGLREKYRYHKSSDKSADVFEAHCTDALALACEVGPGLRIAPGKFLAVDDTYRPVRRKLYDTQFAKGSVRDRYSRGTVFGLRKGLLIGTLQGRGGRLCGEYNGGYRYYDSKGKRQMTRQLAWVSSNFVIKEAMPNSSPQ